ncbi:hypothetical protein [Chishuiella sp.]|uniref:hypothetical protein n=1 Tax=Chishuiella sp. TaxID=1969467 RepID=UPI0028ADA01D|nr:hypothetical protein [Chishuiella sp.]
MARKKIQYNIAANIKIIIHNTAPKKVIKKINTTEIINHKISPKISPPIPSPTSGI